MHRKWIRLKKPEFIRDVLRDFCMIHRNLDNQFALYDTTGAVDFDFLRDLLGEESNKGQLWRLKDTAHLLFRSFPDMPVVGHFLDWGIGYIFHESMKLKEDAYQRLYYGPWFEELIHETSLSPEEGLLSKQLYQVVLQTKESIDREIIRIRFILEHCRKMLTLFLSEHGDNHLLARFFFDRQTLVKEVFKEEFDELLDSIYGKNREELYLLASRSLRQGGWMEEAEKALTAAEQISPHSPSVLQEKEIIDKWRANIKSGL